MKRKEKENKIFEGIRKATPPPSKRFKTRKDELHRKRKHKGDSNETGR